MGATRNTGYIENLIAYDGNNNIGVGGPVNVLYKVTIGGNTLVSGNLNVTGTITFSSNVTANSFVKNGGVATEFLKADGTVDTSTYATVSYVDTSISNLIDAAPAALNTLNELAAALGDDSSFSTTVTTALGNRLRIDTDAQGLTSEQKANGRTNLGVVIGTDVQAYDADLGAIAALTGTSGFLKKTAANTWTLDTGSYLDASTSSTQNGYFGNIYLYDDSTPSHYLAITNSANLTAARTLSINVNDVDRTISLSGNLTVSAAATISGTNTGDQTDITGNSATADKWKTERTITVGATGKTVDGSANVSWTLAEIGAAAALSGASGRVAYWNSNTTIAANDSLLFSPTSTFAINNVITAAAGGASAFNLISTVNAAANNDTLYGVRISPTFNNGAFTGVTQRALGVFGDVYINGSITAGSWQGSTISVAKGGTGLTALGTAGQLLRVNSGATALEYFTPSYLTSYTETDTLQSVISRGATTNTGFTISNANDTYSTPASTNVPYIYLYNTGTTGTSNAVLSLRTNSATGGDPILSFDIGQVIGWSMGIDNSDSDKFKIARSWSALDSETRFSMALDGTANFTGNLTAANLSGTNTGDQDLSGYVTLAGAQTISGAKTFNNDLTITNSRVNVYTGGVGAGNYGIVSGYANSNHLLTMRANITGPTATPTFTYGHQMCFVEYAEANDTTGWFFKTSATTNYTEVARITRSTFNYQGNTVIHSGNVGSYAWTSGNDGSGSGLDADLLDGRDSSGYLTQIYSGFSFPTGSYTGWYRIARSSQSTGGYGVRGGFKIIVSSTGNYLTPAQDEITGFKDWTNQMHIQSVMSSGGTPFSNYRLVYDSDYTYLEGYISYYFGGEQSIAVQSIHWGLNGLTWTPHTGNAVASTTSLGAVSIGKVDSGSVFNYIRAATGFHSASTTTLQGATTAQAALRMNSGSGGNSPKLVFGTEDESVAGHKSMYLENYWLVIQPHVNEGLRLRFVNGVGSQTEAITFQSANTIIRTKITYTDATYMTGSPSYGFRFNSANDAFNNVIMHDGGNVSIRGRLATGNVGVSSPDCMVVMQGNSAASGFSTSDQNNILHLTRNNHSYILLSSPNEYDQGIHFANTSDNTFVGRFAYYHRAAGDSMVWSVNSAIRLELNASGTLTASGDVVAYGSPSDIKLKTIKEKVPNALESILKLNGYKFDWKEVSDLTKIKEDIGVIAQEVAELFPELARTNENGFMSVRYQGLTAVLIEAIKEQQNQIEELKSQIKNK